MKKREGNYDELITSGILDLLPLEVMEERKDNEWIGLNRSDEGQKRKNVLKSRPFITNTVGKHFITIRINEIRS